MGNRCDNRGVIFNRGRLTAWIIVAALLSSVGQNPAAAAPDPLPANQPLPSQESQFRFNQFLGPWKVLGPIDPAEKDQKARMARSYFGIEEASRLPDSVEAKDINIRATTAPAGLVNLGLIFDRQKQFPHKIAYAETIIQSPEAQQVILTLGGDDGVKAWLNNEMVLDHVRPNGIYLDDKMATVTLNAGENRLLIKCDNISEDWGFAARLLPAGPTHRVTFNYHIIPAPVALGHEPVAQVEFLDAAGNIMDSQHASGRKHRTNATRSVYHVYTSAASQPAQVRVTMPGPDGQPVAQNYPWEKAHGQTVGIPGNHTITGRIVDLKTSQPLEGASVSVHADYTSATTTGSDGTFTLAQVDPAHARLYISAPGHLDTVSQFDARDPEPLTIVVTPGGRELIGRLLDEARNPIEGAKISVSSGKSATSDSNGQYRLSGLSASSDQIFPTITHPDYQSMGSFSVRLTDDVTTKDITLKKGFSVAGRITASDGTPVSGAKITSGKDDFPSNAANPTTHSAADGSYKLLGLGAEEAPIFVIHDDFAPEMKKIRPQSPEPARLDFTLQPGKPVIGTTVDAAGKPLAGVGISTDTWRGYRMFIRRTSSDDNGRFQFNHMPEDEVETDFFKSGYTSTRNVILKAGDEMVSVTLHPPTRIEGRVTDARTGDPITSFTIIEGIRWKNSNSQDHWQSGGKKESPDGTFSLVETEITTYDRLIRIQADGYERWEYPGAFTAGQVVTNLEVKLQPAEMRRIAVLDHNDTPVSNAKVYLYGSGQTLWLGNNRDQTKAYELTSDASGHVNIPKDLASDMGIYAEADGVGATLIDQAEAATLDKIVIQPFGVIEGYAFQGDQPMKRQNIVLLRGSSQDLQIHFDATTDDTGKFKFTEIPTGEYSLAVYKGSSYDMSRKIDIGPGQNPTQMIGGEGGTRIFGQAVNEEGEPLSNLYISLRPTAGPSHSANTDADGRFEIFDVPPGDVILNAYSLGRHNNSTSYSHNEKVTIPETENFEKKIELISRKQVQPGIVLRGIEGVDAKDTTVTLADLPQENVLVLPPIYQPNDTTEAALTSVTAELSRLHAQDIGVVALISEAVENAKELQAKFPHLSLLRAKTAVLQEMSRRYTFPREAWGVLVKKDGTVLKLVQDEQALKNLVGEKEQ